MFDIHNNILLSSDWHLYHKNIWIYEFDKRKKFLTHNFNFGNELNDFYNGLKEEDIKSEILLYEYNMLVEIYSNLSAILESNMNIEYYYDLGDFLCNPNTSKLSEYKKTDNYKLLIKIFNLLKSYNIKTILFLGNHDNKEYINFYKTLFDSIEKFHFINGILYSHYPFNEKGQNYGINKKHIKINYHGHTHSNHYKEIALYPNIKYINVSLDNLL